MTVPPPAQNRPLPGLSRWALEPLFLVGWPLVGVVAILLVSLVPSLAREVQAILVGAATFGAALATLAVDLMRTRRRARRGRSAPRDQSP